MKYKTGKVFFLDDDKIFLEAYQGILQAKGYDVFGTDNAYKFLLYGCELKPDVMFLDVNMPKLNGWEVLRQIINDKVLKQIPVVMLTVDQDEDLAHAKDVAHFLYKPLALERMLDILSSYCLGNQNHDILLLEDYEPLFNTTMEALKRRHYSCFGLHDVCAAKCYLQKNNPKKICIRFTPDKFADIKDDFPTEKTIRFEHLHEIEHILNDIK